MHAAAGRRLLDEVEETSVEETLTSLRAAVADSPTPGRAPKPTHLDALDAIAARHMRDTQAPTLVVAGLSLALIYRLVATLAAPPHRQAVMVVDAAGRFDATRLACGPDDLRHIYVLPGPGAGAPPDTLARLVADAEAFLLYHDAAAASRARPLWGTVVVLGPGGGGGGGSGGGDVVAAGWRGWLRVDRGPVPAFAPGVVAADALADRDARQWAVDAAGWAATSPWGGFVFHDD